MQLSLKNKFLFPTLMLILIGMGLVTGVSLYIAQNSLKEVLKSESRQLLGLANDRITEFLNDRKLDVSSWGKQKIFQAAVQDSFVGKAARKAANEQLAIIKKDYKYYESICLANPAGNLLAASDEASVDKFNVSDRDYFQKSIKGAVMVTDVIESKATGKPCFVISAPLLENQQVAGVILAVVEFSFFSAQYVAPYKIGTQGYSYMFRGDGTIIAHPNASHILKASMKDFDFGQIMMREQEGESTHVFEGRERWEGFKKNEETGWTLVISAAKDEIFAPVKRLAFINLGLVACVLLGITAVILFIVNSTVKPINQIITGLHSCAQRVAAASGEISSASQQLAEGASEQAASLEETSSSLEEMASMTKQNAGNANQANLLMTGTKEAVSRTNQSMRNLTTSMGEISRASEETSKIIKTIDEIAFQTNLLALNAAVEAARAGEAGAGFAVVADEVRNLAMRAAQAAKNTSNLIEGSAGKIKDGSELVVKTDEEFCELSVSMEKSSGFVDEIAAASREQALGIEQVSKAVNEIDKVVQQNASTAEEAASASEEMMAQAAMMKDLVGGLKSLITGSTADKDTGRVSHAATAATQETIEFSNAF